MANPTILIGIGTSGLRILENVQRFHYESFGVNKPPHVEYFYIETSEDSSIAPTLEENEIQKVILSLRDIRSMCAYVKGLGAEWVPPLEEMSSSTVGAGGIRPNGRVGFWGKNQDRRNYIEVKSRIQGAVRKVTSINNKVITDKLPVFFVAGSFTGGTGSGIFIDLAYLIRKTVTNMKELYGLFLIPPIPENLEENAQYYANTYGAISDLEYYNRPDTHYKESLPDLEDVDFTQQPYDLTQLISQNYMKGDSAIRNISGLYKMAGLYLFLNIIGVREHRLARLIDSPMSKFGTFGLSGIQYPKDQIQEYTASELSRRLIEKWTNKKQYYLGGTVYNVNRNEIAFRINNEWDNLIEEAIKGLDSVILGDRNAKQQLALLAKEIRDNRIDDFPKFLYNKFTSKSKENYYISVNDNLPTAVNRIIDGIYDLNKNLLDESENIEYAKISLEYIGTAIQSTLQYWRSIGLSPKTDDWNVLLNQLLEGINRSEYFMIGENENMIYDKLCNLFDLLKMHLLGKKLNEVVENLKNRESSLVSTSEEPKKLPKLIFYDDLNAAFASLISKDEPVSFEKRKADILSDIHDETIPILRIFQFGGFEQDVENAMVLYARSKPQPSKTDIIGQNSLFDYLHSFDRLHLPADLYKDCVMAYRKVIIDAKCVQDYDVTKYVSEHLDNSIAMAKNATNVFLPIIPQVTLDKAHYLPRFVAASSRNAIENVLKLFETKRAYTDFDRSTDKTYLEIPELKNLMVFYDEKTGLVPLEMISYAKQIKKIYDHKPKNIADITDEQWIIRTRAYVPEFKK